MYRANTANLVSYLESHGQQIKRVGSTYQFIYTDGNRMHDSITISDVKWYDHKNQRGGYAVKFLQEFLGFSFQKSVIELLGGHCNAQSVRPVSIEVPKPVSKPFELPESNSNMHIVFAYLTKQRFIFLEIISHFGNDGKQFVFEALIDMLSFITLYQKDWQQRSYIAMNGVYESAVLKAL